MGDYKPDSVRNTSLQSFIFVLRRRKTLAAYPRAS